jgi:tetratricopeptide (TPR) repeat protein
MTLRASLLRELENPNLSVTSRAELCCEVAKAFENKGEYEEARRVLSSYWRRIGERPKLANLERSISAEVLLRIGVLTGIIGSKNQITDAQEKAKDLLSESQAIFESQRSRKKIAEAQTELALCYWRTGEIREARDYLSEALSRLSIDSE